MYEKAHAAGKELSKSLSDNSNNLEEGIKHLRESACISGKERTIDKSGLNGNLQAANNELHAKGLIPGLNIVGFENKEHGRLILADKNHHLFTLNEKGEKQEIKSPANKDKSTEAPKTEAPRTEAPKIDLPKATDLIPKEATIKTSYTGDKIWETISGYGQYGEYSDRSIWYAVQALKFNAAIHGKTFPLEGASKGPDGTVCLKMYEPTDIKFDKSIAGGMGSIEGLHVDKCVTCKVESSENEIKYTNICGVSIDMTVAGYHMKSDVKEVKIQHAADGTTYIDATVSNPLPLFVKKGLHMPDDLHVKIKVGADGVAHIDIASTMRDAAKTMKEGTVGRTASAVYQRYQQWKNRHGLPGNN